MAGEQAKLMLPRLGETMDEGTVVAWLKQAGDSFKRGEVIAEIETDKTVVEMPALKDGKLVEIIAAPGTKIAVGEPLAVVSGEAAAGSGPAAKDPGKASSTKQKAAPQQQRAATKGQALASPNAKRVAKQQGVDVATVAGSGRRGRVTAADVVAAAKQNNEGAMGKQNNKAKASKPKSTTGMHSHLFLQHWRPRRRRQQHPWLLIHGLFGSLKTWSGLAASLTDAGVGVYAVDLPGHGRSQASDNLEPASIAADIISAMRLKHKGPLRVAGISLGAVVAAEVAAQDRNITELCMMCPAGLGKACNASFIKSMLAAAHGKDLKPALAFLGQAASELGPEAIEVMHEELRERAEALELMAATWFPRGTQALDIKPALERVSVPARALFGLDDAVLPWQDATALPPHVGAHFLADCGHLPHLDRLDQVLAFLQGRGA